MKSFFNYLIYSIYKIAYRHARGRIFPDEGAKYNFGAIIFFLIGIFLIIIATYLSLRIEIGYLIFFPIVLSIIGGWISKYIFNFDRIKELKFSTKPLNEKRIILIGIIKDFAMRMVKNKS